MRYGSGLYTGREKYLLKTTCGTAADTAGQPHRSNQQAKLTHESTKPRGKVQHELDQNRCPRRTAFALSGGPCLQALSKYPTKAVRPIPTRPEHQPLGTSPDEMPFFGCDETGFATLALCPSGLYSLWLRELPQPRQLNGSDLGLVDPIPTVLALGRPPNQSLANTTPSSKRPS